MVSLNRVPEEATKNHLRRAIKRAEQAVIESALICGIDPDLIDVETHPLPSEVDQNDALLVRLAERVDHYRQLSESFQSRFG